MGIDDSHSIQMTLDLEAGMTERYRSLKECVAAGVYRIGLGRMAPKLEESPGNLSVQLSGDGQRKFDLDTLELYLQTSGDLTPIRYLVAKYCGDASADREEAINQIQSVISDLPRMIAAAGLNTKRARAR